MAHLIYYVKERNEFREEFKKKIATQEMTLVVIKKLLRHFKLGRINMNFTSGRNHSHAGRWNITMNTSDQDFASICHEVAHVYQKRIDNNKKGQRWHGKKHKSIMKRMLNYCGKKDWFSKEIERRTAPKPEKPEPTKEEQRKLRIGLLEVRKSNFERKIRLAENRIKKLNRQISALKRFI